MINDWLVVEPTPLKNMTSSTGMLVPNIWKNRKCMKMFQTTNQIGSNIPERKFLASWHGQY